MKRSFPKPTPPGGDKDPNEELIFTAKLISDDPLNEDRTFIVRFSTSNDEVKVWENDSSGFRGGFFYKSPHQREIGKFDPSIAFIGSVVTVNLTQFLLVGAPDSTLNLMEANPDLFPLSDLSLIMQNLRKKFTADQIRPKFAELDTDRTGRILDTDAYKVLASPELGLSKHEQITITRRYRFYKTNRFLYDDFLSGL
jgi:hypothetical protein